MSKEKKPKPQTIKQKGKKLGIAPVAIIDNIVFSKDEIWAFFQISNSVFDFLSNDQKASLAIRNSNALNNIMSNKNESVDCFFIGTSVPIDVDKWEAQINNIADQWETGIGFHKYVAEQAAYLRDQEFVKKVSILGVCLGKRGALNMDGLNVLDTGLKGAKETLKQWLDMMLVNPGEYISPGEEKDARNREKEMYRILSVGNLEARKSTTEEILLAIKRPFYPAMPSPYLDIDHGSRVGAGDIALETAHAIEKKYRWLKITQMFGNVEVSGYRATMTFAKFPKETEFPFSVPFFYYLAQIGAPFTFYARFTLKPSQKMKLELEKKKKEQRDELENLAESRRSNDTAVDRGAPADVAESIEDLEIMSALLASDKSPWVEGSYRVVVEAHNEEKLREYCAMLKQEYDDMGITLQWTAGDQVQLLLEQIPGDKKRINSFDQITNLHMLSTSGMNFSSDVGDKIYGVE